MTNELSKKHCMACTGNTPLLSAKEMAETFKQLNQKWKLIKEQKLEREFEFPDFRTALAFTNKVGELAENEGHHPDIYLAWGKVKIVLWTHKINGLSQSDFILAAKIDQLKL